MSQNYAGSIMGVRYGVIKNQFRFAGVDVARKFGFSNPYYAVENCCKVYTDINLSKCKKTIDLVGIVSLARNSESVPRDFIDALNNIVMEKSEEFQNYKAEVAIDEHPDFTNPSAAARAWDQQHELYNEAKNLVNELKEILGDGEQYKIVKKIPWLYDLFNENNKSLNSVIGNYLSKLSLNMGRRVKKCRAFGYSESDTRTMYHVDVIGRAYEELTYDTTKFSRYRKKYFVNYTK